MKSKQITVRHKWTASEKDSVDASQKYLQFVWQIICRKKGVQHFALSMDKKHNFLRELCVCQPCRVNGITLHKCRDFFLVRRHLILSNLLAREKKPFIYRTFQWITHRIGYVSMWSDSFSTYYCHCCRSHCTPWLYHSTTYSSIFTIATSLLFAFNSKDRLTTWKSKIALHKCNVEMVVKNIYQRFICRCLACILKQVSWIDKISKQFTKKASQVELNGECTVNAFAL